MKKEICFIRSETWLEDDMLNINDILQETISEFVTNERIINIQVVKESSGLKRFWIYLEG